MEEFQKTTDPHYADFARSIEGILSRTNNVSVLEILMNDIYCQVGEGKSFVFSVEIRGLEAEFFLFDMNFIVSSKGSFELFKDSVLTILNAVVNGDYEIHTSKFRNKIILSAIVFSGMIRVQLHKSLIFSLIKMLSLKVMNDVIKGKPIVTSGN